MLARFSTSCLRNVAARPVWQKPMVSSTPHMVLRHFQTKRVTQPLSWPTKRVFTTTTRTLFAKQTPNIEKTVTKAVDTKAVEVKERNATDWAIIKQLMKYIWPKNDVGVKTRVVVALSLLLGGKVCFFFFGLIYASC